MLSLAVAANPIQAPIEWIVGSIGSYLQQNVTAATVTDPLHLLIPLGDPASAAAQNPLARIVPSRGSQGDRDFQRIAGSIQALGDVLLAVVLATRMLKLVASGRLRSPEHVLLDLAPKLVIGMVAMQGFGLALNVAGQLSMWGAFLLEDALLLPIGLKIDMLGAFPTDGLGVVLLPALYLLVAYLVLLVITSRLVLLLGVLVSPLGIPVAICSEEGRLAATWTRMLVSGLLVPVLAGVGAAGSLALAWLVHQVAGNGPFVGSYLGAIAGECGLLFTAVTTTAMFGDAVKQGLAGVRGSFEGAPLEPVARAPRDAVDTARRAAETVAFVTMMAATPGAAAAAAGPAKAGRPDAEGGSGEPAPVVLRLPAGPGGTSSDSHGGPPQPLSPNLPVLDAHPRRVEGGRVVYEVEQVLHYAIRLSQSAGDPFEDTGPPWAREA